MEHLAERARRRVKQLAHDDVHFVRTLYRALLAREPDEQGLASHLAALKEGQTPEGLVQEFLESAEFRSRFGEYVDPFALNAAPQMSVQLASSDEERRALWANVAQAWSRLGTTEPYRSVLNSPQWNATRMGDAESVRSFYESGRTEIDRLDKWLARNNVTTPANGTCAEYGCGIGRCTMWLAKRFARVVAFDISQPHLDMAAERAKTEGFSNIEFVHVTGEPDLRRLGGVDFFYSIIVLQHSPPPIMLAILENAFAGLNVGGRAYFQVPTYASDYAFNLSEYLQQPEHGMEMHFLPQRYIFELAQKHGLRPIEVMPDHMIGNFGRWISSSFLMAKCA